MQIHLEWFDIAIAISFLVFMTWLGNRGYRNRSQEDFFIGGRNVSAGTIAGTVAAGVIGGGVILVFAEYTFQYGLSALSIIAGLCFGILLVVYIAVPLKETADNQHFYSLPDLYLYKWGRKAGIISTFVVVLWTIGFIVMQLISAGQVLEAISGWDYKIGVIIAAITVASYLIFSGFKAVVITDVLQYIALIILLVIIFPVASSTIDLIPAIRTISTQHMDWGEATGFFILGALNIIVSADLWLRVYAAKDLSTAKKGFRLSALLILLAGLLLIVPPIYARIIIPATPPNHALVNSLSFLLPRWLLGFGLVGVLSTVIATLDTMVFIFGMSVANDVQIRFLNKPVDSRMRSTQITMVFILLVGCIFSIAYPNLLKVGLILSTLGLVLAPSVLSLRWKKTLSATAVEWGIIVGVTTTVALVVLNLIDPEYSLLSLIVSAIGTGVGSVYSRYKKI